MKVNRILFITILAIGAFNTVYAVLANSRYFCNSFLATVVVASALMTFHCYYVVSRDVLEPDIRMWMNAASIVLSLVIFDWLMKAPEPITLGDAAIMVAVLLYLPYIQLEKREGESGKYFKNLQT